MDPIELAGFDSIGRGGGNIATLVQLAGDLEQYCKYTYWGPELSKHFLHSDC